jgi:hypothetical protein
MNRNIYGTYLGRLSAVACIAILTLTTGASCGGQGRDPDASDTTYQRRLAYQEQMSHKVPMDSLNHLYLRLADASPDEAGPIAREIMCEGSRNMIHYGAATYPLASRRAMDSLGKAQPAAVKRAMDMFRLANSRGETATSNADCHLIGLVRAPDSLDFDPVPTGNARPLPKRP